MARATWLPSVLAPVVPIEVVSGFERRGFDPFTANGLMWHHTVGRCPRNSLAYIIKNNLSQILLDCNGVWIIIASGRMNHAGKGDWRGITSGNTNFIGIEAEHPGTANVPWPRVQLDSYYRGSAAIMRHLRRGSEWVCGHKEWANPPGRKVDPISIDMNQVRAAVGGGALPPPPTGPVRPVLKRGSTGLAVTTWQHKLSQAGFGPLVVDGDFGPATEGATKRFQSASGLTPDGIVGSKTYDAMDRKLQPSPTPPPPPKDTAMIGEVVFHPAFPVVGELREGPGHWYIGLPNGTSRWLATHAHKNHLINLGAASTGDRVGDDWFTVYPPLNGPHHAEYSHLLNLPTPPSA